MKIQSLALVGLISLSVVSCKRADDLLDIEADPGSAKMVAETTKAYDDALTMAEEATIQYLDDSTFTEYAIGNCVVITFDATNTQITFDLGTSGCVGLDGRERKGKIIVDYDGVPREPGSSLNITLDDYSVDGYSISGTLTYNAINYNTDGNLEFSYMVENGVYTEPDGDEITLTCNRTVTWTAGAGSENLYDDVFETTGSFAGSVDGEVYSGTTTSPVVFKSACWADGIYYPVSGELNLDFPDNISRAINYGVGACDKDIVITIGKKDYPYTLP